MSTGFKVGQRVRVIQIDQQGTPPPDELQYAVVRAPARHATVETTGGQRITCDVHDLTAVLADGRQIDRGTSTHSGRPMSYAVPVAWLESYDDRNDRELVQWSQCIWQPRKNGVEGLTL